MMGLGVHAGEWSALPFVERHYPLAKGGNNTPQTASPRLNFFFSLQGSSRLQPGTPNEFMLDIA
jgi:hypothetical protein